MIEEFLGSEVFLQGKYLNLGINGSGTLGTKQTAPDGVYTDAVNGFIRLGMVADVDGFGTGKAASRETMLTGTPQEGFSLGYDIGSSHYVRTNAERTSMRQIADGATSAQSIDNTMTATWNGMTAEKVKVDQVMSLADDAKFVRVDITLTNLTGAAMDNVRYMRTIDPDHGPSFSTINTIVEQGGDGSDGALIAAYAAKGSTPFFYYSADDRAKVSTYGLKNYDPYVAAAYMTAQAEGFSKEADESININFNVGTLSAGAKTTITFYFGITDNLNATISTIKSHDPSTSTPPPVLVPINHAPTVANDGASTTGTVAATGNVLSNDRDVDGDALTASLVKGPTHGTLTLAADGSYRYVADKGYVGADSFIYAASDGKASANATVAIDVAAVPNSTPTVTNDAASTTGTVAATGNVLSNDKDADGDALTASLVEGPTHGTLTFAADGGYSYVADKGYVGADSFIYAASDGKASANATVAIDVAAVPNSTPTVANDSASTTGTVAATGNVLSNDRDVDGDALTASLVKGPTHGTLTLAADGSYRYVADKGYVGADNFIYAASDGKASANATVAIDVAAVPNSTPTVTNDAASTTGTVAATGNVLSNDKDADGDALTASLVKGPTHGTLTFAADGGYSYVADKGYVGADSFTYAASDGKASANATVAIDVNAEVIVKTPPTVILVQNGSDAANQLLVATLGHDVFYFDNSKASGIDTIQGFDRGDVIGLKKALYDGNGDGIITSSKGGFALQNPAGTNAVKMAGVSNLRLMGTDDDGTYIYASGSARPRGAQESKMSDDHLTGDVKDKKIQTFFFDTALDLNLGHDTITNFGKKDIIVSTNALALDTDGHVARTVDGGIVLNSTGGARAVGEIDVFAIGGGHAPVLEFDGSITRDGATYYVYSLDGSAAGLAGLVI